MTRPARPAAQVLPDAIATPVLDAHEAFVYRPLRLALERVAALSVFPPSVTPNMVTWTSMLCALPFVLLNLAGLHVAACVLCVAHDMLDRLDGAVAGALRRRSDVVVDGPRVTRNGVLVRRPPPPRSRTRRPRAPPVPSPGGASPGGNLLLRGVQIETRRGGTARPREEGPPRVWIVATPRAPRVPPGAPRPPFVPRTSPAPARPPAPPAHPPRSPPPQVHDGEYGAYLDAMGDKAFGISALVVLCALPGLPLWWKTIAVLKLPLHLALAIVRTQDYRAKLRGATSAALPAVGVGKLATCAENFGCAVAALALGVGGTDGGATIAAAGVLSALSIDMAARSLSHKLRARC